MPKVKISEYSATANSNTDVASINIDEGCAPSGINNAIRAVMGHLKDFQQGTNGDPFNGPHNGTVGATTASTGAFTTLSATGVATFSAGTAAAPAITTTGDTNTGIWFPAADTIAFTEGGVESMRIDASGNLGIGAAPSNKLYVYSTVNANTAFTQANFIDGGTTGGLLYQHRINVQGKSGAGSVQIGTTDSTSSHFSNQACAFVSADTLPLYIYQASAQPILFATNGAERARFNTTGAFVFAGGTTTADGIGITFPATQSGSANANTLDDYEEGTFTATFLSDGGSITTSATVRYGFYTKIGRQVTVNCGVQASAISSPTGDVYIQGLPFAASSATGYAAAAAVTGFNLAATAVSQLNGIVGSGLSLITINRYNAGSQFNLSGDFQSNTVINATVTYFTS